MKMRKLFGAIVLCMSVLLLCTSGSNAQTPTDTPQEVTSKDEDVNLDTQLYLIVGTNGDVADARIPPSLDGVVKQLRASLPFKNYRLAATLVNRVKNQGRLNLRWLGGPFATAASSSVTPSFSEFKIREVRLVRGSDGQGMVRMLNFTFAARIPIQTGLNVAGAGSAFPAISYENTGLDTDISMKEGEPVIVGTLNIGPSGDAIILVVSAKRTLK